MDHPTREQTYQAFRNQYLEDCGTLDGVDSEWQWFIDPELRCAIVVAGRGGTRCRTPCDSCRSMLLTKRRNALYE